MEDNNPAIWEEAYWNTADALQLPVNVNSNVDANGNVNGVASDVLQMDAINTTPSTAAAAANNNGSNGSIDSSGSNTANEMYLLYTAPGYRG